MVLNDFKYSFFSILSESVENLLEFVPDCNTVDYCDFVDFLVELELSPAPGTVVVFKACFSANPACKS